MRGYSCSPWLPLALFGNYTKIAVSVAFSNWSARPNTQKTRRRDLDRPARRRAAAGRRPPNSRSWPPASHHRKCVAIILLCCLSLSLSLRILTPESLMENSRRLDLDGIRLMKRRPLQYSPSAGVLEDVAWFEHREASSRSVIPAPSSASLSASPPTGRPRAVSKLAAAVAAAVAVAVIFSPRVSPFHLTTALYLRESTPLKSGRPSSSPTNLA